MTNKALVVGRGMVSSIFAQGERFEVESHDAWNGRTMPPYEHRDAEIASATEWNEAYNQLVQFFIYVFNQRKRAKHP